MSTPVVGVAIDYCNGKSYRTKPGAKLSIGGYARTGLEADGVSGDLFARKPMPSMMSGEFTVTGSTDIQEINELEDATVVFVTDVGPKYTVRGAYCTKPCELTAGEGALTFEFGGPPGTQTS